MTSPKLEARARQIRARAQVLAWEFRQRHLSKGVWFRLRRALVDAETAWTLSDEEADRLELEGHVPLAVGAELEPRKRIFVIPDEDLNDFASRRAIPVRLGAELLGSRNILLVPWPPRLSG